MVAEEDAPFYEVHKLACHACYMRDLYARDAVESNEGKPPLGRYYSVTPKLNGASQSSAGR